MKLQEQAAFLKGLAEGLSLDQSKPEAKLIDKLIALTGDMADKIQELQEAVVTLQDYCDELDQDLGDVEGYLFDDEDDEDDEYDEDDEDEDDDAEFYEVECPHCGEIVCFDESIDPDDIMCPACGEKFDCGCSAEDCASCPGCQE